MTNQPKSTLNKDSKFHGEMSMMATSSKMQGTGKDTQQSQNEQDTSFIIRINNTMDCFLKLRPPMRVLIKARMEMGVNESDFDGTSQHPLSLDDLEDFNR